MIRASFDDDLITEELKYLVRIFASKAKLQNQLVKLIQNRKNVFTVKENIYSDDVGTIAASFSKKFTTDFSTIWKKKGKEFIEPLQKINEEVLTSDSTHKTAIEIQSNLNLLKTQTNVNSILKNLNNIKMIAFTKNLSIRKRGYLSKEKEESLANEIRVVEALIDEFKNFESTENDEDVEIELAKFGKTILTFFDFALKIYESKKIVDGFIDYEDILLHTKLLLQDSTVKKNISNKYKFIMVDEFQDTNEIQYQIFLPILDYLKSGRLFIVGDEKQSIYKFRDAEIEIFNLTQNDIKKSAGEKNLLVLPDSFRMTQNICAFCNHIFKELFNEPNENFGEVPSTDLVCARIDDLRGRVEFLVSKIDDENQTITEAELIARKILILINEKKYSFKDIAILVRKRKYFADLEKVFLKYEIPFTIIGGRGFYQRQTITDIFNYLSFLADKNNSTALVGLLRSPFFTVSDATLYEISLKPGRSFWKKLNSITDNEEIVAIYSLLKENLSISISISLPQLIDKIITDRNYLSILAARIDGEQEIANIAKLVSIARGFNATGFRNYYDFLNFLKESITDLADESQASITTNADAIQMMTIHQAKGLEFPVVFLYKTDESGISGAVKSGEVKIDKKYGVLTKIPLNGNYFEDYHTAPIIALHNYFEEKKNNAELKRLLYVAVTRAKDELYISTSIKSNSSFKKDSFNNLLSEGLKNDLSTNEIVINEQLEYLKVENDKYVNKIENVNLIIPITTQIDVIEKEVSINAQKKENIKFNTSSLHSREKGEIISASKVSIYSQCPLKYLLIYDYGFGRLNSDYRNYNSALKQYSSNSLIDSEDDSLDDRFEPVGKKFQGDDSALYGKIFHKVMEEAISEDKVDEFLLNQIKFNLNSDSTSKQINTRLKTDLKNIHQSSIWKKITQYPDYKNEFEIYAREKDYYLHGIIDKIIFDHKKIMIFDYKTDDIEKKEIKKHAEYYLMQLKFYIYIASRLFSDYDNFEGSLVFVEHPADIVTINYDKNEIKNLENEIARIINSMRNKDSEKNFNHCKVCSFSGSSNKCIVS